MKKVSKILISILAVIVLTINMGSTVSAKGNQVPLYMLELEGDEYMPKKVKVDVESVSVKDIFNKLITYVPLENEGINPYSSNDVKLLDINVEKGVLTVNLSDEASLINTEEQNYHMLPLVMIKNTASHIEGIESVKILINGDDDISLFINNIGSQLQNDDDKVYTSDYVVLEVNDKGEESIVVTEDSDDDNDTSDKEVVEEDKKDEDNKDKDVKDENVKNESDKNKEDKKEQDKTKDTNKDVLKLDSKYVLIAVSLLVIVIIAIYIINKRK